MSPRSHSILFAVAWILVGGCVLGAGFAVEVSQNFFDWRPRLALGLLISVAVYIGAISASLALHRPSRGPLAMATAVVVTFALAVTGLLRLPEESVSPGTLLGRDQASPLAYRVVLALALVLPAVLLAIRRWTVDASDAWFRRYARRLLPPFAVLALALSVTGITFHRENDPGRYTDAAKVLGGPSGLAVAAEFALAVFQVLLGAKDSSGKPVLAAGSRETDYHQLLEDFFRSDQVSPAIKQEVRASCSKDAAAHPAEAHACAHQVLAAGRARAERRRELYGGLALAAVPIGAFAIAIAWRARRPRENVTASALSGARPP